MKIQIRKIRSSDAKDIHTLINDEEVINQLSGYHYPCPLSKIVEETKEGVIGRRTGKSYYFTILADNKIAGSIMLEHPSKDKKVYSLGFFVGRSFWGKGIATESIRQIINYAFRETGITKIIADNDSINPASGRAMEKAGMTLVKVEKNRMTKDGQHYDLHFWEILKKP